MHSISFTTIATGDKKYPHSFTITHAGHVLKKINKQAITCLIIFPLEKIPQPFTLLTTLKNTIVNNFQERGIPDESCN